tara:strand:- start:5903 stop:6952 length:1050 start_codon:yes stop_codon:yes gene_type:complete
MKILMLVGSLNRIGGIEKYNLDFYQSLIKQGNKVILVERNPGGFLAKLIFIIKSFIICIISRPNYIICGHINFLPILFILNKFKNVRYSISIYGIEIIANLTPIITKSIMNADKIITISNYTKNLILKKNPNIKSKIFILKSAVNKEKFFIKKKDLKIENKYILKNKKVILTLARLSTEEEKGQHRVLEAMPKILKAIPNAVYLIVGGGVDERLNKILKQNPKLLKSIIFAGEVTNSDKIKYYNLADVFVMPSKTEGFGIVFIEALACGLPVICSDGYGCREGLLNGQLGTLVNPNNTNNISKEIISVLNNSQIDNVVKRNEIRRKALEIYGMDKWNNKINTFTDLIRI